MKSKNWKIIKDILLKAMDLEVDERQRYLEDLELDEVTRKEVDSLLAFEEKADDWNPYNAIELARDAFDRDEAVISLIGQTIGNYKIVNEIGFGGMGAVYLGDRIDGKFEQQVAIKMLKREFNTSAIRRRFKKESEIQAKLNSPNIASLIDTGTTADGIPYLVMEYIEGERIDKYCRNNQLKLNQILKLFNKVGDAVSFAHQHLIVHRDLKPSNILITESGEPKLLDFGISKLIDEEIEEKHTVTNLGVMTPQYASPEQVKGQSVSTATDIYSLGVILFELLSGHRPFEKATSAGGNLFKAIIEDEPKKPSAVLYQTQTNIPEQIEVKSDSYLDNAEDSCDEGEKTEQISDRATRELINKTKPQFVKLNPKKLRGDLDNIILKALRKETTRRYRTVEQFTADIWRYLDGLPVTARSSTFGYRASKFFHRNKTGAIAGGIIILVIISGLIATIWQARVARAETAKAQKMNVFLQSVLNFSNPHWLSSNPEKNRKATIAEAIDKVAENIEEELSDAPEVLAEVQLTLGKTYLTQGRYDEGAKMLRSSKEKFAIIFGETGVKTMQTAIILADAQLFRGNFDEAESLYKKAIEVFSSSTNRNLEDSNKWLSIAYCDLGLTYTYRDRLDLGEESTLKSLEYGNNLNGNDRGIIPLALSNLGFIQHSRGNYEKAIEYYHQSLSESAQIPNELKFSKAISEGNIGNAYKELGNYEQATEWLEKSYKRYNEVIGEKHQYTMYPLINLADIDYLLGDNNKGLEKINKALTIQTELFPKGHHDISRSQLVKGKIYTKTGREKEGEELLRKSILKNQEALGTKHIKVARGKIYLGENLIKQKRIDEAKEVLSEASELLKSIHHGKHPFLNELKQVMAKLPSASEKEN